MGWESWLDSGPGLTPRTAAAMALAGGGAGEDGYRLGAELIAQDAKALIGPNTEFDLVASASPDDDLYWPCTKQLSDRGLGAYLFH